MGRLSVSGRSSSLTASRGSWSEARGADAAAMCFANTTTRIVMVPYPPLIAAFRDLSSWVSVVVIVSPHTPTGCGGNALSNAGAVVALLAPSDDRR